MTVHDVPPLRGPILFLCGPHSGKLEHIDPRATHSKVITGATENGFQETLYVKHAMRTIFGSIIPVMIADSARQDDVDAAVLATPFAVAITGLS